MGLSAHKLICVLDSRAFVKSKMSPLIHQHFVKSRKLSKEQGRNLNWLFELRAWEIMGYPCMLIWKMRVERWILPRTHLKRRKNFWIPENQGQQRPAFAARRGL